MDASLVSRVFWDFDGVLGTRYFWHASMKKDTALKEFSSRIFTNHDLVRSWMRGRVSFGEICNIVESPYSMESLVTKPLKDWSSDEVLNTDLFYKMRAQYPAARHYICSDNMDIFNNFVTSNQFIKRNFVKVFNSADYGVLKEDTPGLYDAILAELSLKNFLGTVVLDDSTKNCERFRTLGGTARVVSNFIV